ncbi:putative Alpha/beta hydrolase fold-3 domain-containing protein [Seiridium cardinale]|uniref:Alpha/beta hydrolase fold-3 domain-containing protein n=1 Tax=Seiridium cardinale TaxID=138064 RepID=A0ABR2XNE7_9PEZI
MSFAGLPGRLGDPTMSLAADPRTHPKLLQELKKYHLHDLSYLTTELGPDSPLDDIMKFVRSNEGSLEALYNSLDYRVPGDVTASVQLVKSEKLIPGPDGHELGLFITRTADSVGRPTPALVYFHGGGMIILSTKCPLHTSWADFLARTGLVVIAVDFRNALTPDGLKPFPAGLNDCATAVQWVNAHRELLNISKIILQGESGGGNLALATALKAKREGWLQAIDGVCATVPYISNAYHMSREWKLRELPSLVECDGYLISSGTSALNAKLYDPSGENAKNPLAWPFWAEEEDLKGLPPHLIVTNELDPLRDEGNAYFIKLARAGVRVVGKVNLGVVHEGELFLRQALSDLFLENLWGIRNFVDRL